MVFPKKCLDTIFVGRLLSWQRGWAFLLQHFSQSSSHERAAKVLGRKAETSKARMEPTLPSSHPAELEQQQQQTTQNSLKEIPEVSKVHPEQQEYKSWCHPGELGQHLLKGSCSSPVQLPNVSLGRAPAQPPELSHHAHPKTLQVTATPTDAAAASRSQPRSQGISESWQIDGFWVFYQRVFVEGLVLQGGQSGLWVCLNSLALAGKLSTERVKREKQLLWCNPGPAARDPSLPGGLSSITSGPWHC